MSQAHEALQRLRDRLAQESRVLVAFSGGADSALLAVVASHVLGSAAVAVTAVSASLPARERAAAREFCRRNNVAHVVVASDEMDREDYVANGSDRCYHCKSALFDALAPLQVVSGAVVALGTNLDDLGDHRPGQLAAAERGALAPLVDARFTKRDVREVSGLLGLSTADKPAAACLSSRIAYGEPVSEDVLKQVEAAEAALHDLGFAVCRVRSHAKGTVGRVEVPAPEILRAAKAAREIDAAVRAAGFSFCALDLAGFSSGRMNVLLQVAALTGRGRS
jgi:pyridinium-3,5-biscarboxylic acid mononucleotide sulfurtransferase